jgi:hypothetical protein
MYCVNCGHKIDDGTPFCPDCGTKQTQSAGAPIPPPLNRQPQSQQFSAVPVAGPKKRHGCLTALIIGVVVVLLAAAALYFFVPGLLRPIDLGIRSSREGYLSAMSKLGVEKDESPKSGTAESFSITYGPPQDVSTGLNSEELTSFFNENRPPYYAVKNVQVRINGDGTIEAAGTLDTRYVFSQILAGQYTKQDAQKELPMLGLIPDNVNVYFKLSGSVEDNQVQGLDVDGVKVMGIAIPQSLIDDNSAFIVDTLDSYISRECARVGASVEHLGVSDGKLDFIGSLPSTITRTPAP